MTANSVVGHQKSTFSFTRNHLPMVMTEQYPDVQGGTKVVPFEKKEGMDHLSHPVLLSVRRILIMNLLKMPCKLQLVPENQVLTILFPISIHIYVSKTRID